MKENENGAIVISNGRRENALKYKEVIYDLYRNNYSIYIIDHRGQGFSERIHKLDAQMGHIDDFEFYIDDLKKYYDEIVKKNRHNMIFLIAHSMGGTIGLRYIEKYPSDFNAASFTSPLLGLDFPACEIATLLANERPKYAFGQTSYDQEDNSFESNKLTNSKLRYEIIKQMYEDFPSTKIGGPSYQWVKQACKTSARIFNELHAIQTPLIKM